MNKIVKLLVSLLTLTMIVGCAKGTIDTKDTKAITITLSDEEILVDGMEISKDSTNAVYVSNDIIYYEEGMDETYGEGEAFDAHSQEEAALHTVVHITKSGQYTVSGKLSHGQIYIDLGEDSKKDSSAVVTLFLDGVDITSTVAPAILVTNVYECGDKDAPTMEVDTTNAGFHLVLANEMVNSIQGSYVAKIYKEGTTSKLHKYDGAISSKRSMTISGNGKLEIHAENEGISSDMHLTINGGYITIDSHDDAVNTSEDNVSVFTMNDGTLIANAGLGDEGDGIDSNGWAVFNGGSVVASANARSMDSGLDSDRGIYINGGTIVATGNMYDAVEDDSKQMFGVFSFSDTRVASELLTLVDSHGDDVLSFASINDYSILVVSSDLLQEGDYTLYGATQLGHSGIGMSMGGRPNMTFDPNNMPEGFDPTQMPQSPNEMELGNMPQMPEDFQGQAGMFRPEGFEGRPNGQFDPNTIQGNFDPSQLPPSWNDVNIPVGELSPIFTFSGIANSFSGVRGYANE